MKINKGKGRIKDNKDQKGYYTIKYSKNFIWFGIVITFIFLSTLAVLLVTTELNDFDTLSTFVVIFLFCCISISLSIACSNWQINFNNEHFIYRTTLGKEYKFLFSDVKEYKPGTEIIVLKTDKKRLFLDPKLKNVNTFFNVIEKNGKVDKAKLNEIRLTKGNYMIGISCLLLSVFMSLLFVIPSDFVEDTVTSFGGYLFIISINVTIIFFTLGSLKWRIFLYDESFTYVTYFGRIYIYKYSEVSSISITSHFVIMKVKDKYFFNDPNAIGIENFLRKVK